MKIVRANERCASVAFEFEAWLK